MLIRRTNTDNWMERVFEDWTRALDESISTAGNALALDVYENDDAYIVQTDIPGVSAEAIDVQLHENILTISAETSNEDGEERGNTIVQERRFGKFSRSLRFRVPVNSEAVEADYTDGVLTITVPKSEALKPRRININYSNN